MCDSLEASTFGDGEQTVPQERAEAMWVEIELEEVLDENGGPPVIYI